MLKKYHRMVGPIAVAAQVGRRLRHDDDPNENAWALPLIIFLVILFLTCLICSITCCAVRCFYAENTKGALWGPSVKQDGRWVRPLGVDSWRNGWLAGPRDESGGARHTLHGDEGCTPGGVPMHKIQDNGNVRIVPEPVFTSHTGF